MKHQACTLLALLVSSPLVTARMDGNAPIPDPPNTWQQSYGLHADGDELVGGGPDYKVHFRAGGFELTPALGRNVEAVHPLAFELESIRRGDATIAGGGPTRAQLSDIHRPSASYERAPGVVEAYDVRAEGIEQFFRFDAPLAGSGDLVVRGRITTDLALVEQGPDGLRFGLLDPNGNSRGGVRWGGVTGVDADGRSAAGSVRWQDGSIELVLPAAFVDSASYPLLLDPLIGADITVSTGFDDTQPDVAYDATNATYLVVWQRFFAGSDGDIRGQRLDEFGVPIGGLVSIESSSLRDSRDPAVGNVNQTDRFLIVWEQVDTGPLFIPDIYGRSCNPQTAGLSATALIATDLPSLIDPDVGGDSTTTDDDALVVWIEVGSGCRGAQVTVPAVGPPNPITTFTLTTEGAAQAPAITKSGGPTGRYLVAWEIDPFDDNAKIDGRVVDRNGNLLTPAYNLAASGSLDVEYPDVDGDGTYFALVYERSEAVGSDDDDVFAQAFVYFDDLIQVETDAVIEATAGDDEQQPRVAYTGEGFVVTWEDEDIFGEYELFAKSLDTYDCSQCEPKVTLATASGSDHVQVGIASQFSGDPAAGDEALIAWSDIDSTSGDGSIVAHRYRTDAGEVTDLGGGCGLGGQASAPCARHGHTQFRHSLWGAEPGQLAFLVIGPERLDASLSGCTLVPNPYSAFVFPVATTGLFGNAGLGTPLADNLALVGLTFYEQWAVATTAPVSGTLGADLSNALEVIIQ